MDSTNNKQQQINQAVKPTELTLNTWLTTAKKTGALQQNKIKQWLHPQDCIICHANLDHKTHHLPICRYCYQALPHIQYACTVCNTPLHQNTLCGVCLTQERHWDRCYAAFAYQTTIKRLIAEYKYNNKPALTATLAKLLQHHIENCYANSPAEQPDYLIPVPMHRKRLKQRGYNQSHLLCRAIGRQLNIKTCNIIHKRQATATQTTQTAIARKDSIRNSFVLKKPINANKVVIIDDVMTTGATTTEIAKLLKKSGISNIEVWVLART